MPFGYDAAGVTEVLNNLQSMAKYAEDERSAINNKVATVTSGEWVGLGSDAFLDEGQKLLKLIQDFEANLNDLIGKLTTAQENTDTLINSIKGVLGQIQ